MPQGARGRRQLFALVARYLEELGYKMSVGSSKVEQILLTRKGAGGQIPVQALLCEGLIELSRHGHSLHEGGYQGQSFEDLLQLSSLVQDVSRST